MPELKDISKISEAEFNNEDLYLALLDIKDDIDKTKYINALETRAAELKIKTPFKRLLKAFEKKDQEIKIEANRPANELINTDYGSFHCGAYQISEEHGISTFNIFGPVPVCYHIILPVGRFVNVESNEEMVTLVYKRPGEGWREIIVKRDIIANASKITSLAGRGIAVTSENAKVLVRFLSDFENLNYREMPLKKSTSKMGWKQGKFVPFEVQDILFDGEAKFSAAYNALSESERGSFQNWIEYVKDIRAMNRFENNIYLAASFASVLVDPLDCLPFIVDIYGPSGKGKTVALMMACSVWANPKEGEFISGANSTLTALELKLNFLNNLPLLVDDMASMKLRRDEDFSDFIYRVCAGRGKSRGNVTLSIDPLTSWGNITLTNAERPLVSDYTKGGAVNRIIDVPIYDAPMFADGNEAAGFFKKNYGYAGREFIKILHEIGFQEVKKIMEDTRAELGAMVEEAGKEREEKQLLPMALMITADKIATDYIFKDGIYLDKDKAVSFMKSSSDVSENERAWDYLMDTLEVNRGRFATCPQEEITMPFKWGSYKDDSFYMIKSIFNKEMKDNGFDGDMLLKWAVENKGIIAEIKNGGVRGKTLKNFNNDTFRGIIIPDPMKPRPDKDGFISAESETGLPFMD